MITYRASHASLPLALALALTAILSACAAREPLDAYVLALQPQASTGLEQRFMVKLRLQNPNDAPIHARGMSLKLDVNGAPLARGVMNDAFVIEPLSEVYADVVVSTAVGDLVRQLLRLAEAQALTFELRGRVHTGGIRGYRFVKTGGLTRADLDALVQN